MALRAGDRLPSFNLLDQDGEQRSSDDLAGRPLVLFFYPKDDTPGCTIEACSFRDNHSALTELGAVVGKTVLIGVSKLVDWFGGIRLSL